MKKYSNLKIAMFFLGIGLAMIFHCALPSQIMAYGAPYDAFGIEIGTGLITASGGAGYPPLYSTNGYQWSPYAPSAYTGPNSYYPYGGFGYGYPDNSYGWNQSYNYGAYPYQPSGYAPNYYNYGQSNYSGYYPNYSYSQPQYYGYPYRQSSFNQPFNYGWPSYGYPPNSPYSYPPILPSGYLSPTYYTTDYIDAEVKIDGGDDGDSITLEEGETLSITLQTTEAAIMSYSYKWELDTSELDTDIVKKVAEYLPSKSSGPLHQEWVFEAKGVGTTIIKIDNTSLENDTWIPPFGNTFEIEVTVKGD